MDFENNKKLQTLLERFIKKAKSRDLIISEEDAQEEIEEALLEYYNDRHFTPTDSNPYEDIYAGIIIQLALSSYSKAGAEGETSHMEGGISRMYDSGASYPLALTRKIIPLAKGVE